MEQGTAIAATALGAALFCAVGYGLEQCPGLQPARDRLRSDSVPAPLLDTGRLGALLQRADLVDDVPNDGTLFPRTGDRPDGDEPLVYRRKGRVGDVLYQVSAGDASTFPDSALPPADAARDELMVVSIAVEPGDLDDIHTNWEERIERRAEVTVYRGGAAVHTTRAGLRLHGGHSRTPGLRHSYRLHLRDRYGNLAFPPDLLFEGELDPVKTLIVRRVAQQSFNTCLGYDVLAQFGVDTPHTQPAWFFLNGELQGLYILTEHLSPKQFASRLGHEDFLLFRQRGIRGGPAVSAQGRLETWVLAQRDQLRAADVERYIDLDQLSRYLLGLAVCGTVDWEQGAAFLDLSDQAARWTWIPWDLDRGLGGYRGGFGRLLDDPQQKRTSVPAHLFRGLLEHDADYGVEFAALACELLNHRLTPAFLRDRMEHYSDLRARWIPQGEHNRGPSRLQEQPRILLEDLSRRCDLGPVRTCVVHARGLSLEVDGYTHATDYRGHYFDGQTLTVRAEGVRAWRVDKTVVEGATLEVAMDRDLDIRPILE